MEDFFKFLFLLIVFSLLLISTKSHEYEFNVLDYGALGEGKTDDTNAFANAWKAACATSSASPSTVHVPSHKTFLIRPIHFEGPCNSKRITFQIDGNLVAPTEPSHWNCEGGKCHKWLYFHKVDGLTVRGHGTIDGNGEKWWHSHNKRPRPTTIEISDAKNVSLGGGLRFKDSPRMHIVLNGLESVSVSDIQIDAPENSPNTDGIHVTGCTNAVIDRTRIGTGDDCISIVDGSSFVTITNIICGPGHGVSIGSLGKNGANDKVEHVRVSDVVFIGTQNGARIKTWQGGRGYARHIVFERILSHDSANPIIIDQFYCDHQRCVTRESAVQITNVTYRQVLGTSRRSNAVKLKCSKTFPCKDIVMDDIHIVTRDEKEAEYECSNVYGRAQGHKFPSVSCLDQI